MIYFDFYNKHEKGTNNMMNKEDTKGKILTAYAEWKFFEMTHLLLNDKKEAALRIAKMIMYGGFQEGYFDTVLDDINSAHTLWKNIEITKDNLVKIHRNNRENKHLFLYTERLTNTDRDNLDVYMFDIDQSTSYFLLKDHDIHNHNISLENGIIPNNAQNIFKKYKDRVFDEYGMIKPNTLKDPNECEIKYKKVKQLYKVE